MKAKITAAVIATATIIFISCKWFRTKKKEPSNPLVGEWKLDSLSIGKDTSPANFLFVIAMQDTSDLNISFTKDSVFTQSGHGIDSVGYSFDSNKSQLTIKDWATQAFAYSKLNDSLISLTSKDSNTLFLLKK